MSYEVLLISDQPSSLAQHIGEFFNADVVAAIADVPAIIDKKRYRVLVLDKVADKSLDLSECEDLLRKAFMQTIPLVVLTSFYEVKDKVKALEIGCDDLIDNKTSPDEACARITKSIFHQIANTQLSQRLAMATETARNAMVDNSDLGANVQFLLKAHGCDNLDQLGQQFFATIARYGLHCSLQMRSEMGKKDMEAHGMAKDLESQLLWQLQDAGRYVDFGRRTVINYDRVSLLIKNMPLDDPEKYGAIKDNTFCLVQGVNARILALEDRYMVLREKESLHKLSADVRAVMSALQAAYHDVMRQIVGEVASVAERIQHRLPHLALNDEDEQYLVDMAERLVANTNSTFNDGLKMDELFQRLEASVQRSLVANEFSVRRPSPPADDSAELF